MKNIITTWSHRLEAVASFGQATLHRRGDGRYELHGGSSADHADALEWASLFQHEAVFSAQPDWRCERAARKWGSRPDCR